MVQVESQAGSHLLATFTFCLGVACLTQWTFVRGSSIVTLDRGALYVNNHHCLLIPHRTFCSITPMIHKSGFGFTTAVSLKANALNTNRSQSNTAKLEASKSNSADTIHSKQHNNNSFKFSESPHVTQTSLFQISFLLPNFPTGKEPQSGWI